MGVTKVLVVDDHAVVRDGLGALLEDVPEIEVVGFAEDGSRALVVARQTRADVVLMDLTMPVMDGVEATRRLANGADQPAVLVLTMSDDDASLLAAMRAGARGYLLKDARGEEVVAAIRAVARGEAVFGSRVAPAVLALLSNPPTQAGGPFPQLSQREREVLALVGRGLGNQAIGVQLGISTKTVANIVSLLLTKLPARDRAEAVGMARAERLV